MAKLYSGTLWAYSFLTFVLQVRKNPEKKPHPGNLYRPGIEPGPAAWQVRMLPPVPPYFNYGTLWYTGAKGDLDFWISDLVKNPDGTDI